MNTLVNKNVIECNWNEIKGSIKNNWRKLTDKDITNINGSYMRLVVRLIKLYGYDVTILNNEISDFFQQSRFDKMKQLAIRKIREKRDLTPLFDDGHTNTYQCGGRARISEFPTWRIFYSH